MPNKRMMKKRKRATAIGTVWISVILISGTFAMTVYSQIALNPDLIDGTPTGRMHDVFQERDCEGVGVEQVCRDLHGERNKNVFAENFGEIPIGVRVQIREFVRIGGVPFENRELAVEPHHLTPPTDPEDITEPEEDVQYVPMDINNIQTWGVFQANADLSRRAGTTAGYIGELGVSWELGHSADEPKIFMPTFNRVNRPLNGTGITAVAVDGAIPSNSVFLHNPLVHRFADTSGRAVDAMAGGFDIQDGNYISDADDVAQHGTQTGFVGNSATGYQGHTGMRDFWDDGQEITGYRYFINANNTLVRNQETHIARATMEPLNYYDGYEFNGVMSLEQWMSLDMPAGNFWIMDTDSPDGWFYWNGEIPPGEATSLLLNATNLPPLERFEYITRIEAEFFILSNLPDDVLSTGARFIFERPTEETDTPSGDTTTPDYIISAELSLTGTTATLGETVTVVHDVNLLLYQNGTRIETVEDANFDITLVETDATSSLSNTFPIQLNVALDEPNRVLTLRITEPRADGYIEVTVDIQEP